MKTNRIRLHSIVIDGIKNVEHGELKLDERSPRTRASVLGLYGQNGSGKTTLVNAVEILKMSLTGEPISKLTRYVGANRSEAKVEFGVSLEDESGTETNVWYTIGLEVVDPGETVGSGRLTIKYETIRLSAHKEDATLIRKCVLIDTSNAKGVFGPIAKYDALVGDNEDVRLDLEVEKRLAYRESRSFVFSEALFEKLSKHDRVAKEMDDYEPRLLETLRELRDYGYGGLFVVLPSDVGLISIGALPLRFRVDAKEGRVTGMAMLPLSGTTVIDSKAYSFIQAAIENMDIVLEQLVPGMSVSVKPLETITMKDGGVGYRVQLMSRRNGVEIPLEFESDGIKRIVSFLHLLALMFGDPKVTVAIDELDSGVFEYLLGELTRIVSESAKGQLVFTSHNLRPLETIDRRFVAFTTTNPSSRYIKLKGTRDAHNLRNFYYRDIQLGGQDEELYDATSNGRIKLAFLRAGKGHER